MLTIEDYRNYFRHQCKNHPDLLHEDVSGRKVFEVIDVEEAEGAFRTEASDTGYIFRLINYTFALRSDGGSNALKQPDGGFVIAKLYRARSGGVDSKMQALSDAERIGLDIIEKMVTDSREGHPLFHYSIDSVDELNLFATPRMYAGDTGYAGWIFTFNFRNFQRTDSQCDASTAWLDGGKTPY